jgi:hypothetical protein
MLFSLHSALGNSSESKLIGRLLLSRAQLLLVGLLAFLVALAVMAVSAAACGSGAGKEATTITTKLSGESKEGTEITVLEGAKVKDKATLGGKNVSKATGKVKYDVYADKECKTLVTAAGEGTVSGESVTASEEKTLEAGKTYYWQATYEGNETNSGSSSSCANEVLNVQAKTTLATKLSGESKEAEELSVLEGAKVKDKASLSGTNSSTATGKVAYKVYSEKECKTLVKEAGEVTLEGEAKIPASTEEEPEAGRAYYWQASYKGDALHQESTSTCGKEVLDVKAATKLATSLKDEEHSGESVEASEELAVTDTATLSGTNSGSATGAVTYKIYTEKECKTLQAEAGEVVVSSGAVPASHEETLPGGTYYWQATYGGDSLHEESKSTCGKEIDTVKASAALSTTLSGEGQSSTGIEVLEGAGITDDAMLNGADASKAGGTVTYDVYSEEECRTVVAEAGKVTVTSGTVPASTEEKLKAGTYYWQATYSGDANDAGETTACGEATVIVNTATSLTTTLSGGGQEGESISVSEGTKITDKATLSGTNASKAGGSVVYDVYSEDECKTLVTEVGEVTVSSGAVPASGEETLSPGTYYWQAFYSGESDNHQSTSSCKEVSVVKAATSLASSLTGGGYSHERASVLEGTGVADDATLSGENASKAGGTVTYDVYSEKECKTLAAEAGKVSVTSGSVPASTEETLKAGTYYWQATYSGDANNLSTSSTCGKEVLTVNKTLLGTSLVGEGQSGEEIHVVNGAVHDTATLSGENASIATGKVKYDVYSEKECRTLVAEAGEVTVSSGLVPESKEETLAPGTYYWQAAYSGDSHNEGSTTPCDAAVGVVGPTPPEAERVEFTNAMAVIVDHPGDEPEEKPEAIEEFTGKNSVQWEYSPAHNEVVKSWPLAYAQETTPSIKARFELPAATKQLILERQLEGKPVVSGHATVNGETISFSKEFASAEEVVTQVKNHEGYIEIGETTGVTANKGLPAHVAYEVLTIEWEWTIKVKGTATNTTQSLGASTLNLYLTAAEPAAPACKTISEVRSAEGTPVEEGEEETGTNACTPLYLSLLDAGVRAVEQARATTPAEAVAAMWRPFLSRVLLTQVNLRAQQNRQAAIRVPTGRLTIYHPGADGPGRPGGTFGPDLQIVSYYEFVGQGRTANLPINRGPCTNVFQMLERGREVVRGITVGVGRCGAWADVLALEFRGELGRRVSPEVVRLTVSLGTARECNELNEREVCTMLVKSWSVPDDYRPSGNAVFPYKADEVKDELGEPGQTNENPPGYFWDHAVVKVGIPGEGWASALYDPSYGSGPVPSERELAEIRAEPRRQPSPEGVVKKYQEASIAALCKPTRTGPLARNENLGETRRPAECRELGPNNGRQVLQLKAERLTWP